MKLNNEKNKKKFNFLIFQFYYLRQILFLQVGFDICCTTFKVLSFYNGDQKNRDRLDIQKNRQKLLKIEKIDISQNGAIIQ